MSCVAYKRMKVEQEDHTGQDPVLKSRKTSISVCYSVLDWFVSYAINTVLTGNCQLLRASLNVAVQR